MSALRFSMLLLAGSAVSGGFAIQESQAQTRNSAKPETSLTNTDPFTNVSLFEGIKSGVIDAKAVGTGDG